MGLGGIIMKRNIHVVVFTVVCALVAAASVGAAPLPKDMSGYYKFDSIDGAKYSAKAEMGDGTLTVHILPSSAPYIGTIVDDKIYFSSEDGQHAWAELRQLDETRSLVTTHNADTGEIREFTVFKTTKEEAEQIASEDKVAEKNMTCSQNLSKIGLALGMYARDHNGEMPYNLGELYPEYATDKSWFVCPARGGQFHDFETDYQYIPGFCSDSPNPDQEALVIEVTGNHEAPWEFHQVLYLDGHVRWVRDGN
jgi:hypothetical protein